MNAASLPLASRNATAFPGDTLQIGGGHSAQSEPHAPQVVQLRQEIAELRFERDWLRHQTSWEAWRGWLSRQLADDAVAAWWVERATGRCLPVSSANGLFPVDSGDLAQLPPGNTQYIALGHERAEADRLTRVAQGWAIGGRAGALVLTNWPTISGHAERDRELVTRLAAELEFTEERGEPLDAYSTQELDLVRDMLELRALTDAEFTSPEEMLREFLERMCDLTGLERASLILRGDPLASPLERQRLCVTAGSPVPASDAETWSRWETEFASQVNVPSAPTAVTRHELVRTAVSARVSQGDRLQGCLLLSSRQEQPVHATDRQLIDWAGQFVAETFVKAVDREQLEHRARRDALTGLANRHVFDQEFPKLLNHCRRDGLPCSLLLIDLDHFKQVNDTRGHLAGDEVLREVARRLTASVQGNRVTDRPMVARYGGEEFAVLLPEVELAGAERIAGEVLEALRSQPCRLSDGPLRVTASIGLATAGNELPTPADLFTAADDALYRAKNEGRDCCRKA